MRYPERAVQQIVREYGMHETLKALIEFCYARAQAEEISGWREMARELTQAESLASRLRLDT